MNKPIINGIDVSECKYLNKVVNEEPYCNIDEEHLYTCSSDESCYFKQLKRLQEENEELKEKCKKYSEINEQEIRHYVILTNENKQLTKVCQEYKDRYCELYENADQLTNKTYKYKQALEEISRYCEEQNLKADYTACEILTIIDKVLYEN